jgi:hypothetical protein
MRHSSFVLGKEHIRFTQFLQLSLHNRIINFLPNEPINLCRNYITEITNQSINSLLEHEGSTPLTPKTDTGNNFEMISHISITFILLLSFQIFWFQVATFNRFLTTT